MKNTLEEAKKIIYYIDFDDFVKSSGVKESTIKRRYKQIPGITKTQKGFRVISGTRYPYNIGNTNIEDSASKRFTLLKAISKYKYISNKELRLEPPQFEKMLRDLLFAGLIECNNLSNFYGANAYDCTPQGEELISQKDKAARESLIRTIAIATGTFTGAVLSQIFDAAQK